MSHSKFNSVTAIVRSYDDPRIGDFCRDLSLLVDKVVVVVPTQLDNALTPELLKGYLPSGRVYLQPTLVSNWNKSWSEMLNAGLHFALGMAAASGEPPPIIFNVSNTTSFRHEHIRQMLELFQDESVGLVGTTFAGSFDDNTPVKLGVAYSLPRNTGMMIRSEVFSSHPELCSFDPRWDGHGGMEDCDFLKKMEYFTPYRAKMLDLKVPLRIGRHRNHAKYVELMEEGLRAIEKSLQERGYT